MKLKATFQVPQVNFNRYRSALNERMGRAITEAAREWVRAIVVDARYSGSDGLPIWSAASVATFSHLANAAGYKLSYGPVSDAPNRISLGEGKSVGFFGDPNGPVYSFTYATTLPHLIVNEYYNANDFPEKNGHKFRLTHPGPYHFQEKGVAAFQRFCATELSLPGWSSVLDTTSLTVG